MELSEEFRRKLDYIGYKGINLDRISVNRFSNFPKVMPTINRSASSLLSELSSLSLEEVRALTKKFCQKYFSLRKVPHLSIEQIKSNMEFIRSAQSNRELYDRVNSLLTEIDPLDIKITLTDGHSMIGDTLKPLLLCDSIKECDNRKVIFSYLICLMALSILYSIFSILTDSYFPRPLGIVQ